MVRKRKRRRPVRNIGLPPGELVGTPEEQSSAGSAHVMVFSEQKCSERTVTAAGELPLPEGTGVVWVSTGDTGNVEWMRALGQRYNIPPLLVEDVVNFEHRPKVESGADYTFITLKNIIPEEEADFSLRQLSIFMRGELVITFEEGDGGLLEPLCERIRQGKGRVRAMGGDYLSYAVIDFAVDRYFLALDATAEALDELEERLIDSDDTSGQMIHRMHRLRRGLMRLRRAVWPLREIVSVFTRESGGVFSRPVQPYLRDLYDHVVQIIDMVEGQRDTAASLLDLYLSAVSNRMNSVMKVLTMISTIFIPLSFVAGVYGMNFEHMPELKFSWGYPAVLGVMAGVAGLMLYFFRRNKWF